MVAQSTEAKKVLWKFYGHKLMKYFFLEKACYRETYLSCKVEKKAVKNSHKDVYTHFNMTCTAETYETSSYVI